MQTAILFNAKTGTRPRRVTSAQFEGMLEKKPALRDHVELYSISRGVPVVFRKGHGTQGHENYVRSHFASASGYGLNDHVFLRQNETLAEAVQSGKHVLLSLNVSLSPQPIDFRNMKPENGVSPLEDWIQTHHGDYISISVRSAEETIRRIRAAHKLVPRAKLSERISTLYAGGVMGYRDFYLGERENDLVRTFKSVQSLTTGLPLGETRAIGFPHLIRFIAAKTTLAQKGTRGLKGNALYNDGEQIHYLNHLVFEDKGIKDRPEYASLWQQISTEPEKGVYVLAVPTVTRPHPDEEHEHGFTQNGEWNITRWIIKNISHQTAAVGIFEATP